MGKKWPAKKVVKPEEAERTRKSRILGEVYYPISLTLSHATESFVLRWLIEKWLAYREGHAHTLLLRSLIT